MQVKNIESYALYRESNVTTCAAEYYFIYDCNFASLREACAWILEHPYMRKVKQMASAASRNVEQPTFVTYVASFGPRVAPILKLHTNERNAVPLVIELNYVKQTSRGRTQFHGARSFRVYSPAHLLLQFRRMWRRIANWDDYLQKCRPELIRIAVIKELKAQSNETRSFLFFQILF